MFSFVVDFDCSTLRPLRFRQRSMSVGQLRMNAEVSVQLLAVLAVLAQLRVKYCSYDPPEQVVQIG